MSETLETLEERKAAARKAAFARRKTAHQTISAEPALAALEGVLAPYHSKILAGYMPIRTEIDPRPVMINHSGPVLVPVIIAAAQPLKFARWHQDAPMVAGAFGAQIPQNPEYLRPDILIVPLVAFDRNGGRLGYGGGFYDRSLQQLRALKPTLAIGFAYAAQEASALPLEATDQQLDYIVTEQEVIAF